MPSLIQFGFRRDEALTITDDAISYAVNVTNNLLYETGLNSPYRILVEAQIYVYDQFVILLKNLEQELRLIFFELLGFSPLAARQATATLKFELPAARTENTYFRSGFPVRATNGKLFLLTRTLIIPSGSRIGYVSAIAAQAGSDGNLPRFTINQGLLTIDSEYLVTNESPSTGGSNGEQIVDLQTRVGYFIRGSGLVTKKDIYNFIRENYPNYTITVNNDQDVATVDVYACYRNGDSLTPTDYTVLNTELQNRIPLGVRSITLHRMDVVTVFIEVIVAINRTTVTNFIAPDINARLRAYIQPYNQRQVEGSTRGIIINNELTRVASGLYIDYIQAVNIGLNEESAYGQNFAFNPINQRVKIGTVKVVMVQNDFTEIQTFTK